VAGRGGSAPRTRTSRGRRRAYTAAVEQTATGARVTITAHNLLRDLTLYPDRLHPDAEVDLAGVTLLPGESVTFTVTGATGPARPH
jgi:beta-mannosidase